MPKLPKIMDVNHFNLINPFNLTGICRTELIAVKNRAHNSNWKLIRIILFFGKMVTN